MRRYLAFLLLCAAATCYAQDRDASKRGTAVRLTPRETQTAMISSTQLVKTSPTTVRLTFDIALPEEYVRRREACIIYPYVIPAVGDETALMPLAIAGDIYYKVRSDNRQMDFIQYNDDEYLIRYTAEAQGDFGDFEPGFRIVSVRSSVREAGRAPRSTELFRVDPSAPASSKPATAAPALPVNKVYRVEFGQDPDYDSRGFSPSDRTAVQHLVDHLDSLERNYRITVNSISVSSYGAPFGKEGENRALSQKRVKVVSDKIKERCPSLADRISTESVAENWAGFRSLVEASDLENKESVLADIDCIKNVELRKIALKKVPNYDAVHALMKESRKCIVEIDYTEMQKEKQL